LTSSTLFNIVNYRFIKRWCRNRMNSLPTFVNFLSLWTISRFNYFFPSFSRYFFNSRSFKFYYNDFKFKDQKINNGKDNFICLISYFNSYFIIIVVTSFSRSYYDIINRPKLKYILLWSERRWGPSFIPALVLIFWAPRSLYFNLAWFWFNLPYYYTRKE